MRRDISMQQFLAALARHGMTSEGFMGYVRMPIAGSHCCVSYLNAPSQTWRARLAFLLAEKDRIEQGEAERLSRKATVTNG